MPALTADADADADGLVICAAAVTPASKQRRTKGPALSQSRPLLGSAPFRAVKRYTRRDEAPFDSKAPSCTG